MTRRTSFTNKRSTSRDSYQTPNYANLVQQNPLQVAAQPQLTFVNTFRQNFEIDPLDPDQTIATPEEVPQNAITAAQGLLAGLSIIYMDETTRLQFCRAISTHNPRVNLLSTLMLISAMEIRHVISTPNDYTTNLQNLHAK
ncbi:MAG: hypothetical protein EZS28_019598 [Streblomastix strix]|uniref:Uncharacterized protein n=1 Tax=Streblomastix strix TaxID=222440 RepID=A0A5J4VQL3_9EUKA|nr:MAG: hypothetical protein EZS28_019598 [Streblomastix strix]